MQVKDIMTKNVEFININNTAQQAAMMMKSGNYGSIPVERNNKLAGMVTDRDLALRVVAEGKDPKSVTIAECMTAGIKYCFDDESIETACDSMIQSRLRRLPVLNRDKKLVGIVSLTDIAVHEEPLTATHETFQQVCH